MHAALTVRVGAALSQKIYACDAKHVPRWCNRSAFKNSAKFRQAFSHVCSLIPNILFIFAEQSVCCPIWVHVSHHRHIFFDSVQPLIALSEERAFGTFFSLFLSAIPLAATLRAA